MLMAQARVALGQKDKAVAALERGIATFPTAAQFHFQLGNIYFDVGDLPAAAASFSEAIKHSQDFSAAIFALARTHIRQRSFGLAIPLLTNFIKKHPTNGEAQVLLAQAHET
jgi:predicted Zn-dependent protease